MARGQIFYALMLVTLSVFQKSHAQIFIGDTSAPGILWAPLPTSKDDTNIMDTDFTLISISTMTISDIAYDPGEMKVYWCDLFSDKISRIQLNGQNSEELINTDYPRAIALDLLNRKIYWTSIRRKEVLWANLDSTGQEVIYDSSNEQPFTIFVDPVNANLYWASRNYPNVFSRADLNGSNRVDMDSFSASTMIIETCADNTTRLFYYAPPGTLAVTNLDRSENETFTDLSGNSGSTLNKYGGKLFWQSNDDTTYEKFFYEYDMLTSKLTKFNSTVRLENGSYHTFTIQSVRISTNMTYDEPVAIKGCPSSFTINLDEGSNSTSVSWPEPKLNSWSSCPSMEFSGDIINGQDVSTGEFNLLYMANDAAGNDDICQFVVTVQHREQLTTTPLSNPAMTSSDCDNDQSGGGTTFFSFSIILRTLVTTFLFVITLN